MEKLANYIDNINEKHSELILPRFKVDENWNKLLNIADANELLSIISSKLDFKTKNDIIMELNDKYKIL